MDEKGINTCAVVLTTVEGWRQRNGMAGNSFLFTLEPLQGIIHSKGNYTCSLGNFFK